MGRASDRRLSTSEDVARVLRDRPPTLDEVTRARLERAVVAGTRRQDAAASRDVARARLRWGAAGVLAAAAMVGLFLLTGRAPASPVAHFEVLERQATARRGTLEAGSVLPTGPTEEASLVVADSRVQIGSSSRVRIAALTPSRLDLVLAEGVVQVEFHPRRPGEEHLTVSTPEARVEVVGTVFRVESRDGRTEVSVQEGVVRVRPLQGDATELRAGDHLRVPMARASTASAAEVEAESADSVEAEPPAESVADEPLAESAQSALLDPSAPPSSPVSAASPPAPVAEHPAQVLARAERLVAQGRTAAAAPLLERLVRTAPRRLRARASTLLADIAQREGRLDEAAEDFERAVELGRGSPTGANALYALARLHERRRDRSEAVRTYTRYLEVAPAGPLAPQARQALCRLGESTWCSE